MKILITGGDGFIGSSLINWLLENTGHEVYSIDNLSSGNLLSVPINDRLIDIEDDITKKGCADFHFRWFKPDVCFHFAAYASEGRANNIRTFIHQNNTIGTLNIINACVNYNCKLIFTSSVAVYSGKPPFSEHIPPRPIDEYGISKYCSELSIRVAGQTQSLNWTIIRPRNVFGIHQNIFDPSRNLFGIFCYNAINRLPLTIFGEGDHKRSFTYIDDILEPLYKSIDEEHNNEIFNLGSGNVYTILEAANVFAEVSGYNNIIHTEERHEVGEAFCSTWKSEKFLGFKDKTTLKEGLTKMWEWAKTIPMQERLTPPKLETTKNAHSSLL